MLKYAPFATGVKMLEMVVTALMVPLSVLLMRNLVDSIGPFIQGTDSLSQLILWAGLLLLSMMFSANIQFFNAIQYINMQRIIHQKLTGAILKKFMRVEYRHFEDAKVQDTLLRMGNQPQERIFQIFLNTVGVLSMLISMVGLTVIYAQISVGLMVGFIVLILAVMWSTFRSMNIINSLYIHQSMDERKFHYYGQLISDKHTLFELRIFNAVEYIKNLWKDKTAVVLDQRLRTTIRAQKYAILSSVGIVGFIGLVIYYLIGALEQGDMTVGLFTAIVHASIAVLGMTELLAHSFANLSKRYLEIQHYDTFMALSEENRVDENATPVSSTDGIVLENVHFAYPNMEEKVLRDISLHIAPHEKVALVGRNGTGKSTLVKLLCGLYSPDGGVVRVRGQNPATMQRNQLKNSISVVFQDFGKYNLSVRENIAMGQMEKLSDDEALQDAMRQGLADAMDLNLDQPLGKLVDDGVDLSGGQWQRLAIARACIADSDFIILDEPTAALDPIAESEMYHAFAQVLKDRGCIMISHRLASARMCDRILVLEDGRIVENGSHEQLMRNQGLYAQMYQTQSQWYQGVDHE